MDKVKWMRVMCFKHDGSIHRVWDKACKVYEDDEAYLIYISKMECYVLNKTDLISGTHEEFLALLTSVLPAHKIERNLSPKQ